MREKKQASKEAEAMGRAFRKATKEARVRAFEVRTSLLVERDGWLVRMSVSGKILRRVKKLEPIVLPKA